MVREMVTHHNSSNDVVRPHPFTRKAALWLALFGFLLLSASSLFRILPRISNYIFSPPANQESNYQPVQVNTNRSVWVMIGQVNQSRILSDLRKLTGAESICLDHGCYTISDRKTGSLGLIWAEDYIVSQLDEMGYTVQIQDWSLNGYSDRNLIVRKPGKVTPGEEIYFVAHIDGESCPAADDNASGVASLLELARVIRLRDFNDTIVLLFSTGEEQSTLGVTSYIDLLTPEQLAAIKYVVNVDMVSYDTNKDGVIELFNGNQPVDFVQLLSGIISSYQIGLVPQIYSDCG